MPADQDYGWTQAEQDETGYTAMSLRCAQVDRDGACLQRPCLPGLRAVCTLPVIEDFFLRILLLFLLTLSKVHTRYLKLLPYYHIYILLPSFPLLEFSRL